MDFFKTLQFLRICANIWWLTMYDDIDEIVPANFAGIPDSYTATNSHARSTGDLKRG
jgi:hypothetical protein